MVLAHIFTGEHALYTFSAWLFVVFPDEELYKNDKSTIDSRVGTFHLKNIPHRPKERTRIMIHVSNIEFNFIGVEVYADHTLDVNGGENSYQFVIIVFYKKKNCGHT